MSTLRCRSLPRPAGWCGLGFAKPGPVVAMYVRHEAVLSSQIEGTQSTLEDVLEYEADSRGEPHP